MTGSPKACEQGDENCVHVPSVTLQLYALQVADWRHMSWPLEWRHNGHDCVSNHQPHHYILNRLFGWRSKKTSKSRVAGLRVGNSPGTGEFPAQMASNAENVSIWWRHHALMKKTPMYKTLSAENPSTLNVIGVSPDFNFNLEALWCLDRNSNGTRLTPWLHMFCILGCQVISSRGIKRQ